MDSTTCPICDETSPNDDWEIHGDDNGQFEDLWVCPKCGEPHFAADL